MIEREGVAQRDELGRALCGVHARDARNGQHVSLGDLILSDEAERFWSEVEELLLRGLFAHDGVDLDRREARGDRGIHPVYHARHAAASGERPVTVGIEGVERDVDRGQTRRFEVGSLSRQDDAVRGHRALLEAADTTAHRDEADNPATNEWFVAGEADLRYAEPDRALGDRDDLFEAEHLRVVLLGHGLGRHAVFTPEVALVGHRDAKVVDGSLKTIERARRSLRRAASCRSAHSGSMPAIRSISRRARSSNVTKVDTGLPGRPNTYCPPAAGSRTPK